MAMIGSGPCDLADPTLEKKGQEAWTKLVIRTVV